MAARRGCGRQVFDGFEGDLRAEIHAPLSGLLITCGAVMLYEGDLIARIQSGQIVDVADTFLSGQGQ